MLPMRMLLMITTSTAASILSNGCAQVTEQGATLENYVLVGPGKFVMGEFGPNDDSQDDYITRTIEFTYRYYVKKTEVTQKEYYSMMGSNPSTISNCDDCPVDRVSWRNAVDYAVAMSRKEGFSVCYKDYRLTSTIDCDGYRLPIEAEWEFAARAGSDGSRYGSIEDIAWYKGNSNGRYHEVARKKPNRFGLFDMIGNVSEWTYDTYGFRKTWSEKNPTGHTPTRDRDQGDIYTRVVKGGNFESGDDMSLLTFAGRAMAAPRPFTGLGFRLVRTAMETESSRKP